MEESRIALGEIALEEGHPDEALVAARAAAAAPGIKTDSEDSADANALAARALLAMGKGSEAAALLNTTLNLLPTIQNQPVRLKSEIAVAQVEAVTDSAAAGRRLGIVVGRANKAGLPGIEMEARLAEAEIMLQKGEQPQGLKAFAAIEKDAKAHSYMLIARKASAHQR